MTWRCSGSRGSVGGFPKVRAAGATQKPMQAHFVICLSACTKETACAAWRLQSLPEPISVASHAWIALRDAQRPPVGPLGYLAN